MAESAGRRLPHDDRVPLKTTFDGVRVVPGAIARWGSHFEPGVVLMPSYTNIGGYVGAGSMVDTWATVGSCAQIGKNVHLSGGVGIGGVLEPLQAAPVVVEDEALIGSRAMIVEGARVRRGAGVGAGAILAAGLPVLDVETGEELGRGGLPEVRRGRLAPAPCSSPAARSVPCVLVLMRWLEPGQRHDKAAAERRAARARRRA